MEHIEIKELHVAILFIPICGPKKKCKWCSKSFIYKGVLTAHIRRLHPLPAQPKKDNKVITAMKSTNTATNTPSVDTQELHNFMGGEKEFDNAVEQFGNDIGVNDSMVEWFGMNFQSSFTNTGKFPNRTAPNILPINFCKDCKVSCK